MPISEPATARIAPPAGKAPRKRDGGGRRGAPRIPAPRTIAFLIFDNFQLLDAAGPISAFEMPMRGHSPSPYTLRIIAVDPGAVRSSSGASLHAEAVPSRPRYDTLIVAGGAGTREAMADRRVLALVRSQAARARRLCSVCSGAYILAAAGVLDGRRATTHWRRSRHFAAAYPNVRLEPDRIYTRDGNIWTSAGITAGIDLSLALIADDLGEDVARAAAKELVVYHRRPGGQSQFSALLDIERVEGRFTPLLAWMRERLNEPLTVDALAAQACMSPRNFARAFTAETGVTPAKAVERLRLEAARKRVEHGADPIDAIALASGFCDPNRMRKAFLRAFGQPPQAMRRLARA
ncbi:MAG: GlxA family transcriptional regulator [Alphaproteobacteria bacterium]|nr:GlxA family transcriptional regulator [Alphaproteobacteria bacterium]